jgi:hypothetical protein
MYHHLAHCTLQAKDIGMLLIAYYSIASIVASSMMYQDYWIFGLFPSSGILGNRNTNFWKPDLFPSSGEGGGGDIYSVGPLRKS